MASKTSKNEGADQPAERPARKAVAPSAPRREAIQVAEEHGLSTSAEPTAQAEQWADEEQRHRDVLREAGVDEGARETEWVYKVVTQANPLAPQVPTDPGPDTGPLQSAVNSGYRPTGVPRLGAAERHADGISWVHTWTVPVLKVKDEINPDKPVEKDADVDPTQPGPEVTG